MYLHVDNGVFLGAHSGREQPQAVDRLILSMHPKYKVKKAAAASAKGKGKADGPGAPAEAVSEDKQKQMRLFPGLALPDTDWVPSFTPDDPATVKERRGRVKDKEGGGRAGSVG